MRRPARLSLPRDRREVSRALSAAKGDILWAKERFTVYSRPSSTRFFHALVINSFSGCVTSDGFVRSFGGRHPSPSRKWRLPRYDQTHRPRPVSSDLVIRACARARSLRRRRHEEGHNVERLDVQGLDEEGQRVEGFDVQRHDVQGFDVERQHEKGRYE